MNQFEAEKTPQREPLFNIGAVSRMTEIPEATLRVWERRYQFPNATRTGGGHRLYSQHEIRRIQWVKRQIDAGMQASLAIQALYRTEQDNSQPLAAQETPLPNPEKTTSTETEKRDPAPPVPKERPPPCTSSASRNPEQTPNQPPKEASKR